MIDRYSITASADTIRERFSVDVPEFYKAHYNAAPTHALPVITSADPRGLSSFYWGMSPAWSKNKQLGEKVINTWSESFTERPALKKALMKSRCLVPADGFYGWKKVGKKIAIPYRFILNSREPFSIAALWEEFEDTDGNQIQTFTMITHLSNELVSLVQERMPVILTRQAEKIWLDPASDEETLLGLLTAYPGASMNHYPVSPAIADNHKDVPSLIIPTPPADQHGNLTLFD
jgi:putative SOS response-associated peptidase YedK